MALGGDTIEIKDTLVYVNGAALPREPAGPQMLWDRERDGWRPYTVDVFAETIAERRFSVALEKDEQQLAPDFGPTTVPVDHYFVMGDNRDHSFDSRAWGPVPLANHIGRAHTIWWSSGHDGVQTDRLGKTID